MALIFFILYENELLIEPAQIMRIDARNDMGKYFIVMRKCTPLYEQISIEI